MKNQQLSDEQLELWGTLDVVVERYLGDDTKLYPWEIEIRDTQTAKFNGSPQNEKGGVF